MPLLDPRTNVDWLPGVLDEDDDPRAEDGPFADDERDFYRYTDDPSGVDLDLE